MLSVLHKFVNQNANSTFPTAQLIFSIKDQVHIIFVLEFLINKLERTSDLRIKTYNVFFFAETENIKSDHNKKNCQLEFNYLQKNLQKERLPLTSIYFIILINRVYKYAKCIQPLKESGIY